MEKLFEKIITKKEKLQAFKAQLKFRQNILKQPYNVKCFQISESQNGKTKQLGLEELKTKCNFLIEQSQKIPVSETEMSKSRFFIGKKHFALPFDNYLDFLLTSRF